MEKYQKEVLLGADAAFTALLVPAVIGIHWFEMGSTSGWDVLLPLASLIFHLPGMVVTLVAAIFLFLAFYRALRGRESQWTWLLAGAVFQLFCGLPYTLLLLFTGGLYDLTGASDLLLLLMGAAGIIAQAAHRRRAVQNGGSPPLP